MWGIYFIVLIVLLALELVYIWLACRFHIVDEPNARSSHTVVTYRGGGVVFTLSMVAWAAVMLLQGQDIAMFFPFLCGLVLLAGVNLWDDVSYAPRLIRLMAQVTAAVLMLWSLGLMHWEMWWFVLLALIVCVGAANVFNFMDGINGMTVGYAQAVLIPLLLMDVRWIMEDGMGFIDISYLVVAMIGVLVFGLFNIRPRDHAICFSGDVGSIGMAFILLFAIGKLIVQTGDVTYMILLLVYGVDGCLTILHRLLLHEKLIEAHRKHAYQLMVNELRIGQLKVASLYMTLQLAVSFGFIFLCPNTLMAHWLYLIVAAVVLCVAYVCFVKLLKLHLEEKNKLLKLHLEEIKLLKLHLEGKRQIQEYRCHARMNENEIKDEIADLYEFYLQRRLDWSNLQRYTEKMQWKKLYYIDPLEKTLADKYAVRKWVAEKIGEEYLIPILGVWDKFEDIDFNSLPERFVLKTTHASANIVIVKDKNNFNKKKYAQLFKLWLSVDYAYVSFEMHYKDIPRRIIAEPYLENKNGELPDFKFMCFDGKPYCCLVDQGRFSNHTRDVFDMNWNLMSFTHALPNSGKPLERPHNFEKMVEIASVLSQGFSHVRVDLYNIAGTIYFGELTFTSHSGFREINPDEYDFKMGEMWKLPIK